MSAFESPLASSFFNPHFLGLHGLKGSHGLLMIMSLLLFSCKSDETAGGSSNAPPPSKETKSLKGTRVEVAIIEKNDSGLSLRVPGEVEGAKDVELAASLGGYIESVLVKEGDHVKKGALLARVDGQTHSTRLSRAQVEVTAAKRELKRAESLKGTIPQTEIDGLADRVASTKASLRELQVNVERSTIKAPFAGVIVRRDAEVGEVAAPGSPLFRLVQLNPVHISVSLSDRDLAVAQKGMRAQIKLEARSEVLTGKVIRLSKAARLKTRSFEAIVEAENPQETLLPGMIAQVTLSSHGDKDAAEQDERLFISQDWLVTQPDGVGVFLVVDGKASWRDLELGGVLRRQVEVRSGLVKGDRLIIVGHRRLADGDLVLAQREGHCCTEGRVDFTQEKQ